MDEQVASHTVRDDEQAGRADGRAELQVDTDEIVDELLIEEISIDGMCGVY